MPLGIRGGGTLVMSQVGAVGVKGCRSALYASSFYKRGEIVSRVSQPINDIKLDTIIKCVYSNYSFTCTVADDNMTITIIGGSQIEFQCSDIRTDTTILVRNFPGMFVNMDTSPGIELVTLSITSWRHVGLPLIN